MSQPDDAAAQALRLAALALQQISARSSSSSDDGGSNDDEHNATEGAAAAASDKLITRPSAAEAASPTHSPNLSSKLLSSVAQVVVVCRYTFSAGMFVTRGC